MNEQNQHDLIILGGGPAGMTAAVYAAHAGLDAVILEENVTGGLVNSTYTVKNFPTYESIGGMELMEKMRGQVDALGVEVEEVCEIEGLSLTGETKTVTTDEGVFSAKAVILCTGRKPTPLEVPTQCDQMHHCAICDGSPYKGKHVLVVGGGNSAFDESLYLLGLGVEHITLVECMDRFFAAQSTQDKLFASGKVDAQTNTVVRDLVVKDGALTAAVLENTATGNQQAVPVDGAFVFLGQQPNSGMFKDVIELSDKGYVLVDANMRTNVPGVFSAGDINDKAFRQITTAMADGTIAALAAERYIRS